MFQVGGIALESQEIFTSKLSREIGEDILGHYFSCNYSQRLMVALPVSSALYHQGTRWSVIFTFLGVTALVRIPRTLFEASFLGAEFTTIRWLVSLLLIIISSLWREKYLVKQQFQIK